ncbi:uncharacterized protein LOC144911140 [Branchiostoma floridae x Branchiostoma belcheri]
MLGLLLSCVVFSVGVSSSQGESVYLTTLGGLAFHKVRVSGEMTNTNVKATCEGLGMRYPCFYRGGDRCSNSQFYTTDCVGFDTVSTNCATFNVIAYEVCPGVVNSYNCPALDDVFLYRRYWTSGDGAYGLDHQTTSYVSGAGQFNMWALCTGKVLTTRLPVTCLGRASSTCGPSVQMWMSVRAVRAWGAEPVWTRSAATPATVPKAPPETGVRQLLTAAVVTSSPRPRPPTSRRRRRVMPRAGTWPS